MVNSPYTIRTGETPALWLSIAAYAASFAAWTLFSIIGVQIERELRLTDTEFGLLVATPLLAGSIARVLLGLWVDRCGTRRAFVSVMIVGAAATFLLSLARTYQQILVCGLAIGIVGASFVAAVAHVSQWYPTERQTRAFDVLGIGIAGAAITHVLAPTLLVAHGWRAVAQIWAAGLWPWLPASGLRCARIRPASHAGRALTASRPRSPGLHR